MVDLFFILSGFVMARTYGPMFQQFDRAGYGQFLAARFARVYPLYFLITVSVFVLTELHVMASAPFPLRALVTNIPLAENLGAGMLAPGMAGYLVPPGWSISTEAAAYLAFPGLSALALWRTPKVAACLLTASAAVLYGLTCLPAAWLDRYAQPGTLNISSGETLWPLLRCFAGFSIGLVVHRLAGWQAVVTRGRWWAGDAFVVGTILALWWRPGMDIALVVLFALVILQICTDGSPLARVLGSALPHRFGEWSYAIYLMHWPMLSMVPAIQHRLPAIYAGRLLSLPLTIVAAATIGMAAGAHYMIEKPARRALRRFFNMRLGSMTKRSNAPWASA